MRALLLLLLLCSSLFGQVIPRPGGGVMWSRFPLASAAFSPTDLTGLVFRVTSTNLPVNSSILSWTDHIGGIVLTQATAALRPTNSSVGLWFSNTQFFAVAPDLNIHHTNPCMVVIAPNSPPLAPSSHGAIFSKGTSPSWSMELVQAGDIRFKLYGNSFVPVDENWFAGVNGSIGTNLVTVFCNGGTDGTLNHYYTNGVQTSTANSKNQVYAFSQMGIFPGQGSGWNYRGYIMEIDIWSNRPPFTTAQVSNLYHYATNTFHY